MQDYKLDLPATEGYQKRPDTYSLKYIILNLNFVFMYLKLITSLLQWRFTTMHREEHSGARHKKQTEFGEGF